MDHGDRIRSIERDPHTCGNSVSTRSGTADQQGKNRLQKVLLDPKELETGVQTKICTGMFIALLFTVAEKWKQPKCPSSNDWINKTWYIHAMEYYSA